MSAMSMLKTVRVLVVICSIQNIVVLAGISSIELYASSSTNKDETVALDDLLSIILYWETEKIECSFAFQSLKSPALYKCRDGSFDLYNANCSSLQYQMVVQNMFSSALSIDAITIYDDTGNKRFYYDQFCSMSDNQCEQFATCDNQSALDVDLSHWDQLGLSNMAGAAYFVARPLNEHSKSEDCDPDPDLYTVQNTAESDATATATATSWSEVRSSVIMFTCLVCVGIVSILLGITYCLRHHDFKSKSPKNTPKPVSNQDGYHSRTVKKLSIKEGKCVRPQNTAAKYEEPTALVTVHNVDRRPALQWSRSSVATVASMHLQRSYPRRETVGLKTSSWQQQAHAQAMRASVHYFSPPINCRSLTHDSNISNFRPEPGSAPFIPMQPVHQLFPNKMMQQFRLHAQYSPQQETLNSADIEANPLPDSPSTAATATATVTTPAAIAVSPAMSLVSEGGDQSSMLQRKRTETLPLKGMGEESDLYVNIDVDGEKERFIL